MPAARASPRCGARPRRCNEPLNSRRMHAVAMCMRLPTRLLLVELRGCPTDPWPHEDLWRPCFELRLPPATANAAAFPAARKRCLDFCCWACFSATRRTSSAFIESSTVSPRAARKEAAVRMSLALKPAGLNACPSAEGSSAASAEGASSLLSSCRQPRHRRFFDFFSWRSCSWRSCSCASPWLRHRPRGPSSSSGSSTLTKPAFLPCPRSRLNDSEMPSKRRPCWKDARPRRPTPPPPPRSRPPPQLCARARRLGCTAARTPAR